MIVCENKMVRKIFRSKSDEGTEERRKLRQKEHDNLYSSQNIIWMIKS
jgi:hypothetical protein